MREMRLLMAGMLLGGLVGAGFVALQAQPGGAVLASEDYDEIGQLYATINHGGDFRDAELWLSAFADDAVFTIAVGPGREFVGKEAITEWRHASFRGQTGDAKVRHWDGPPRITPAGPGKASARSYFMVYDVSGKTPTITSSGYHDDVFAKTGDGWRVQSRKVFFDAPPG